MGMMTVRNIPDDVHDALRAQAKANGRSAEAEVRIILGQAVKPESRLRMGEAIAAISRESAVTDEDWTAFDQALEDTRDATPSEPMSLK